MTSSARLLLTLLLASAISAAAGSTTVALAQDPATAAGFGPGALEQAREESGIRDRPRTRYELPAGVLRLSRSELLAAGRMQLELSMTLDRDVSAGRLEVTLPRRWVGRSGVSGLPYARVPASGRATAGRASARRSANVVALAFDGARAGDVASFALTDNGIVAGTYRLAYRWSDAGGASAAGQLTVTFYRPVREAAEGDADWTTLMRDVNASNSIGVTESETFITAVPGNAQRFLVGANGGGYNAWITNDGGSSFTLAPMSASLDAPGEAGPETTDLCCDPMSAADAAGNIWYGGLSRHTSAASPSRIVVARSAPATSTFVNTVGLKVPAVTTGVQDKPMMTIDNSPTSPTFGRLYVIWGSPTSGLVVSTCETRPGAIADAANCDNADNWTAPAIVETGSLIYADVATGPDGKVYTVWWDYSAANAIRGVVCDPATQNCAAASGYGAPATIATLDATGATGIPFSCPIRAQPGGRASTSPQVDVDRSGGANANRVYVTWSDLRTGSGTTKCSGAAPAATHLTFDNFVASAVSALPGSANPSPAVATRLLTDGEGGGQANSDDWFAWLAVDQTTGRAWADFYSTRDDATRTTTNFYFREVVPSGGGHILGALQNVSTAPSDYSANPCCTFGNDYGDYTGIDATQDTVFAVWSDRRVANPLGEAFTAAVAAPAAPAPPTLPPPPPPVAPPPPPPPPPAPVVPPVPDTLVFALTGATTQRPLRKNVGLRVTLSCPLERCTVAVKATITIPSSKRGGRATTHRLKSSTVTLTAGRKRRVTFRLSKVRRGQVASRLRRTLTRTSVKALVTATAKDAAGSTSTKRRTIRVRR